MIASPIPSLLGIRYPIFQGGMAWIADGMLAAAVSEAGGLGIISAMNAGADHLREQIRIAREVLHSRRNSPEIGRLVKGLMIESYIEDGAQGVGEHTFGKSITDPCLGWEKTEQLIFDLAEKL